MKKKFLSLLTVLALVLSMMPAAMAAEGTSLPEADGNTIKMTQNVTLAASGELKAGVVGGAKLVNGQVLDGDSHTLTVTGADGAGNNFGVYINGGATIRNLTISGANRALLVEGIKDGANVTLDHVILRPNGNYALNVNQTTADTTAVFSATGCEFYGWSSYSNVFSSVTFTDCTFGWNKEGGYATLRPYGTTSLNACTFETGATLSLACLQAGETVTLEGCDVGGTQITAENMTQLLILDAGAAIEKNGKIVCYPTLAAAITAAEAGDTVTLLSDETISDVNARPIATKAITIDGANHSITYTGERNNGYSVGVLTVAGGAVKNLTIVGGENGRALLAKNWVADLTVENCNLSGVYGFNTSGGNTNRSMTFTNTTFNSWTSYDPMKSATFTNCTINANFKPYSDATLIGCTFGADATLDEEKQDNNETITFSGTTIVNSAAMMVSALNHAANGATIKLDADITLASGTESAGAIINKPVTIDLNGKTITADAARGFRVYADATFKNGTIKAEKRCIDTRSNVTLNLEGVSLIATGTGTDIQPLTIGGTTNGTVVNAKDSVIDASESDSSYGIIVWVKSTITLDNTDVTGWSNLYLKGKYTGNFTDGDSAGSVVTVKNGSVLKSTNVINETTSNDFASIVIDDSDITVNIIDSTVNAVATGTALQYVALVGASSYNDGTVSGSKVNISGNSNIALEIAYVGGTDNEVVITGGTFATDPSDYVADGYVVSGSGPYTVSRYVAPSAPTTPSTPTEPETTTPSVDTSAPTVSTETKENADGSTTTTETKENGVVVETTTNTDGSKTESATKTETVETEEGKTTTTTTSTTTTDASGNTSTESKEEVKVETASGTTTTTTTVTESATKTETKAEVTETVKNEDGTETTTTTSTTETALTNGSTGTTTVASDGTTTAEVTVSSTAVAEAAAAGAAVELAMPAVTASTESEAAAQVTVTLPAGTASATVEIPVDNTSSGVVAVIVNADGTEEVIKTTIETENGIAVEVPDGATIKVVDNSKDFADVSSAAKLADDINFVASRELFTGTTTETFSPDADATRGQMMTVLARYDGVEASGSGAIEKGMDWAVEAGISDGTNASQAITRQQLVTMLWRLAGEPTSTGSINEDGVADYAKTAMAWAIENGILTGFSDGTYRPEDTATRAQLAAFVARFVKLGA